MKLYDVDICLCLSIRLLGLQNCWHFNIASLIEHVLFAITKSWRISPSALRSRGLIALEQDKIDNLKHASILS